MEDILSQDCSIIESTEYQSSIDQSVAIEDTNESIQEFSDYQQSYNDVSDNNTSVNIFSFRDDSVISIHAPVIRDDDLYENTDLSVSSIEMSMVSSDLQTSGSSVDSEPFGHLHFTEPLLTSTPRKPKVKTSSRLHNKKISQSCLKRAKKHDCECPRKCTQQKFFTKEMMKKCHNTLWSLCPNDRMQWFHKKFDDFQSTRKGKFSFRMNGHSVCLWAWLIGHGISKSIYYRQRRSWMEQDEAMLSNGSQRKLISEKRLELINWFGEYVATRGENPPHIQEIWLPFGMRKNEIFAAYKVEMELDNRDGVSYQSFLNIWKDYFSHVKIKQSNLFTRCTTCDKFDRSLHQQLNPEKRSCILKKKQEHLHRQMKEKIAYYRRKVVSRRRPDRFISLIIDGMDQSKTNIPHFKGRQSKEFAATKQLNVHVTGVLSHGCNNKLLFTDFHQYKHDSNLTLNVLLKVLWDHSKGRSLPPVLYLQADNCFRENKNKFVLSFLELLVRKKIFYEVQLSFLHVGHTHEDIDQMFSVVADQLRHKDATTLLTLKDILHNAEEIGGCFDISGWLAPHLRGVKYHTRTNAFRFRLNEDTGNVFIYYRKNVDHSWKVLNGSFFTEDQNGSLNLPKRSPSVLNATFEKIDIENLKKNFKIWKTMMREPDVLWWENFIEDLEESSANIRGYSRQGATWYLPKIPKYDQGALENSRSEESAVPEHLLRMLTEEENNPEVFLGN